jgi:hypothetical protein
MRAFVAASGGCAIKNRTFQKGVRFAGNEKNVLAQAGKLRSNWTC